MLRKSLVFASLLTTGLLAGCERKEKIVEIDATGPKGKEISIDVEKTPSGQVDVEVKRD